MPSPLPSLRQIQMSAIPSIPLPSLKIQTDSDVEFWKSTRGYRDYAIFLKVLNESAIGVSLPWDEDDVHNFEAVDKTIQMLDILDGWIDEIPPFPTPQRFGNLAFRTWGQRLEDNISSLLTSLLPPTLHPSIPHLSPYLLTSFGSFKRMDYGTGHELSFALFLCCLSLLRFFVFPADRNSASTSHSPSDSRSPSTGASPDPTDPAPALPSTHMHASAPKSDAIEDLTVALARSLALKLYPRYLRLTWRLQDTYNLEPAGSHGVWGLDDSSFLGYIWGSGQLRDSPLPPTSILDPPPLPPTNLYNLLITRIHQVKHGPFHEHSSQLYSIATGVRGWGKVNSGLFKMYEAEVLGKRVVVQHIPLGGLLDWDVQPTSPSALLHPRPLGMSTTFIETVPHGQVQGRGTEKPTRASWVTAMATTTIAPGRGGSGSDVRTDSNNTSDRSSSLSTSPRVHSWSTLTSMRPSTSGSMGPPLSASMDVGTQAPRAVPIATGSTLATPSTAFPGYGSKRPPDDSKAT